jgi:hypothetical protein
MAGWLLRLMGRVGDSKDRGAELVRVGCDGADRQVWGWGLAMLGAHLHVEGAVDEAVAYLTQAAELLEAVPDYVWIGISRAELGHCYLRQMQPRQALVAFEDCNRYVTEHGVSGYFCAAARNGLADANLLAADQASGVARSDFLKKARRASPGGPSRRQTRPRTPAGRLPCPGHVRVVHGAPGIWWLCWRRSLAMAETLSQPYESGLTHLGIGKREADRQHLKAAEVVFDAMRIQLRQAARATRSDRHSSVGPVHAAPGTA